MLDLREIAPETPRLLSRTEYGQMVALGLFEGERVELLEGTIVSMSPHGPEHDSVIERLNELLVPLVIKRARVRIQSGFAASQGSEPEPDIAVVPVGDYSQAHPTQALLIIEVANTSLAKDRGLKARLYAQSGVAEYWVVNLVDAVVEVFSDPRNGIYSQTNRYAPGETITVQSLSGIAVGVSDIFGR